MSRWTLSTFQFNRQWEFSWMALNMTPLKHQKIHWRSVPGTVGGSLGSALEVANRWACLCGIRQEPSTRAWWGEGRTQEGNKQPWKPSDHVWGC